MKTNTGCSKSSSAFNQSTQIGFWCAVARRHIVGPTFFENAINSEEFVMDVLVLIFVLLTEQERELSWFQQDRATANTARVDIQSV